MRETASIYNMSFKFRRSDKQALEQALSETIDSALCYPEPADRLQYVGAALASKVGETAPQPDAEQGESPTPNRQRRYVTELQTSISTALAEAVRKPDDGRPIMAVVAESLNPPARKNCDEANIVPWRRCRIVFGSRFSDRSRIEGTGVRASAGSDRGVAGRQW